MLIKKKIPNLEGIGKQKEYVPQWLTFNIQKGNKISLVNKDAAHGYNALKIQGHGTIFFGTNPPETARNYKMKISCYVKGKGKISFTMNRYKNIDGKKRFAGHTRNFLEKEFDTPEWQKIEAVYSHTFPEKNPTLRIDMFGGECFLDDVKVEYIGENSGQLKK